jgi:sterol desaturase/sphingolipid hydroxylase (fatty acid hydroxylase superfamily)
MKNMAHLTKKSFYALYLSFAFLLLAGLKTALSDRMSLNSLTTICVFIMIAIAIVCERILTFDKKWNQSANDVLPDFLLTMLVFPAVVNGCRYIALNFPTQWKIADLSHLPLWFQILVGILSAEFLFYWIHRACHENKFLWKIHARHHSVKRVYWMNSGTLNPVDMIFNFAGYTLPFALLTMNPEALEYTLYFTAVTGLLEHANVDFSAGVLNYIFNTAELHRWHHSVVVDESQKNYGKALSIWDLAFGSYYLPKGRRVKDVGIDQN